MKLISQSEFNNQYGRSENIKRMGGMLDENELSIIISLINHFNCRHILEIGVNNGGTAKALLSACKIIERYYGVDKDCIKDAGILAADEMRFHLLLAQKGSQDKSMEWYKWSFDLIFIDGNHHYTNVKKDNNLARRTTRKASVIAFHDYNKNDIGVKGVVRFLDELDEKEPNMINLIEGSCICFYIKDW